MKKIKNITKYEDGKHFLSMSLYLKKRFGCKVYKVPLNIGCGCPNRDGTKGVGGCTYCSADLSGDFIIRKKEDIAVQYSATVEKMSAKWGENAKCIAYFQSGTNTYGNQEFIKKQIERTLDFEKCVGVSIGTRADCLEDDMVGFLSGISKQTYLTVELGLQTVNDRTGKLINRCMDYAEFLEGYNKLQQKGINTCVHIINGLPYETKDDMLETAAEVNKLKPHCIKIHMLDILKNTEMAKLYLQEKFPLLSLEEYIEIVCGQLRMLDENIIIGRLTGDGKKEDTLAPLWTIKKVDVLNGIDKYMIRNNIFSGDKIQPAVKKC